MIRLLRRRIAAFVCTLAALLIVFAGAPGPFRPRVAAAAAEQANSAPFICPVEVRRAVPLDPSKPTIAFELGSLDEDGRVTGALTLYAGNRRYDVPFAGVIARGFHGAGAQPTPIVVELPDRVTLDSAFVGRLGSDTCPPGFIWHGNVAISERDPPVYRLPETDEAFAERARLITPVRAVLAAQEPDPSCAQPSAETKALKVAQLDYPSSAVSRSASGRADVRVLVLAAGPPAGADIVRSSGDPTLDSAAVTAAKFTTYTPERFRCQDVYGTYLFHAEFSIQNAPRH